MSSLKIWPFPPSSFQTLNFSSATQCFEWSFLGIFQDLEGTITTLLWLTMGSVLFVFQDWPSWGKSQVGYLRKGQSFVSGPQCHSLSLLSPIHLLKLILCTLSQSHQHSFGLFLLVGHQRTTTWGKIVESPINFLNYLSILMHESIYILSIYICMY
jgi:hypothetical protein